MRCESISLGHISSIRLTSNEFGGQLSFDGVDGPVKLEIMNVQRAEEIARALSTQVDRARVSIEHRLDAAGSLSLTGSVVGPRS